MPESATITERFARFLSDQPPMPVLDRYALDDDAVTPLLKLAEAGNPALHALMTAVIGRHTSFAVFDYELYSQMFLRGRRGESWNENRSIVGDRDICVGRNGAGDIYVWNADTQQVRFHVHDEGWCVQSTYDSMDDFLDTVMEEVVDLAADDTFEDVDDAYLACFGFALDVAGDESLDGDVRELLVERGLLAD